MMEQRLTAENFDEWWATRVQKLNETMRLYGRLGMLRWQYDRGLISKSERDRELAELRAWRDAL